MGLGEVSDDKGRLYVGACRFGVLTFGSGWTGPHLLDGEWLQHPTVETAGKISASVYLESGLIDKCVGCRLWMNGLFTRICYWEL